MRNLPGIVGFLQSGNPWKLNPKQRSFADHLEVVGDGGREVVVPARSINGPLERCFPYRLNASSVVARRWKLLPNRLYFLSSTNPVVIERVVTRFEQHI